MAKKKKFSYKNLKVNEEELSVTKIGEIATAGQNPIFVLFFFAFLLGFIFFLPTIVKYIQGENEKPDYSLNAGTDSSEEKENIDTKELTYYDFGPSLTVSLKDGIKMHSFKLVDNVLHFTITNNGTNKFYFSKHNYFLEIYTDEKTLLERIILAKEGISKEESLNFSYDIQSSTATNMKKLVFVEKEITDYPNISLTTNEMNEETLTCNNNYETITYKFKDAKLTSINDVVNYVRNVNDTNYESTLSLWKTRSTTYSNTSGVTSTFIDSGNGFVVSTVLDVEKVKVSNLENDNYYVYETLAKVINFEMEARGFSCQ